MYDFSVFPTLTTKRLHLRELETADAADLFIFRSDPVVQKYNAEPMAEVAEAETFIARMQAQCAALEYLIWGVTLKEADTVIGMVGLDSWNKHHRRAEVGYDLARAYWGRGIGSEAVRAVLRFGFTELNLNRIEAATIADNHESVRMLSRLGFQLEGIRRGYSWEWDGTFHDSAMFGLLRHEFAANG